MILTTKIYSKILRNLNRIKIIIKNLIIICIQTHNILKIKIIISNYNNNKIKTKINKL